jgi:ketosteroid isomerase-like protein
MMSLIIGGCGASLKRSENTVHTEEMQALLEGAYRAMAVEQLAPLLELYAHDAVIQSAGEPAVVGRSAIESFWSRTFSQYRVSLTPNVEECTAIGDAVVVRGRALGEFSPKSGGPQSTVGFCRCIAATEKASCASGAVRTAPTRGRDPHHGL